MFFDVEILKVPKSRIFGNFEQFFNVFYLDHKWEPFYKYSQTSH